VPEGEREEIREIFRRKGFSGDVLEKIVEVITRDRRLWVDTMLTEELGLQLEGRRPLHAGLATFVAFLIVGLVPLLPFLPPNLEAAHRFAISAVFTGLAFASVGVVKGVVLEQPKWRSGLETLLTGGGAAILAYIVGLWLRQAYGII
jgi:VIT1/CCC1 family predicted Fe2+/Mn2+ transporter